LDDLLALHGALTSYAIPLGGNQMAQTRRTFLEELIAVGLLTGSVSTDGLARAIGPSSGFEADSQELQSGEHDSYNYWSQFCDFLDTSKASRDIPALPDPSRKCQFLHNGPKGLRYATEIQPDELLDHDGDVTVNVGLGQFHPGTSDQTVLKSTQSSQLRLDFVQTKPFMNIVAPLAWTALAGLYHDKAGKLPSLEQLGFRSPDALSGIQKILLTGGAGKFALNASTVKPESIIHKILKGIIPIASAVAPVLNLPAISIPALKAFTDIFSLLESRTKFLLNNMPVQIVATRQALSSPEAEVSYIPLINGDYLLVPQAHTDELGQSLEKLKMQQGYAVSKDASTNESLETRAQKAIPGVTYVSVRFAVAKLEPGAAGAAKPAGAETQSGTAGEKGAAPKGTGTKPGTRKPGPPPKKP
jgi:hypothetical protein